MQQNKFTSKIPPQSPPPNAPKDHPPIPKPKMGVLLVNLGTPDKPDFPSLWRYLRQFLSDRRVIEVNRVLWQLILHLFILTRRPQKVSKAYASIWHKPTDESPLRYITRMTAAKLKLNRNVVVDWAMRYGKPAVGDKLRKLVEGGVTKLLLVPLYPQYSATTTATVNDEAFRTLLKMRYQPSLRVMPPYHDHPLYIKCLADQIKAHLKTRRTKPQAILCSFHGLPLEYLMKGDPYHCHCAKTARLLRERLKLSEKKLFHCFQSRFGKAEWLQPYTAEMLTTLPKKGIKDIVVITPGFVADCLETLEEIAVEGVEIFKANGGKVMTVIPCLNDSKQGIKLLKTLVANQLKNW